MTPDDRAAARRAATELVRTFAAIVARHGPLGDRSPMRIGMAATMTCPLAAPPIQDRS